MLYQYESDYLFDSSKFDKTFKFTKVSYPDGIKEVMKNLLILKNKGRLPFGQSPPFIALKFTVIFSPQPAIQDRRSKWIRRGSFILSITIRQFRGMNNI